MSTPYICGRCRYNTISWRRILYKTQLHSNSAYTPSDPLPKSGPWNGSFLRHRALSTAAQPVFARPRPVAKDGDGHLHDMFNSVARPSAGSPETYRQAPSQNSRPTIRHRPLSLGKETNEEVKEKSFLDRLDRALTMRNVVMAEHAWREVEHWHRELSTGISKAGITHKDSNLPSGHGLGRNRQEAAWSGPSPKLYCRFLLVFMSLRRPDLANEVWKHTVQAGMTPNQAFWTAMLSGCRGARDTHLLEEIWKRLVNSGIRPDAICWSTRIHALMVCGKYMEGIEALKNMGHNWRKAAEEAQSARKKNEERIPLSEMGDVGSIVKPTIDTINSALMALLRYKQIELAQSMLNWASTLGIQPNRTTFNTLLKYTIQEDSPQSGLEIYKTMEAAGVKPDIYTFSIIFDGFFRYYYIQKNRSESTPSRKALVELLFSELEAAGVPPSIYTYGIMIGHLLPSTRGENDAGQTGNMPAVQAVLKHMKSKHLKPNAHINTILLTYYLSCQPIDIDAIASMWKRIKRNPDDEIATDNIFYERLLDGYVRMGDVPTMLEIFRIISRRAAGFALRWDTMRRMVGLLVDADRSEEAAELVGEIVRREGLFRERCRGSVQSEREFWKLVEDLRRSELLKVDY